MFRNNAKSVHAKYYTNHYPSTGAEAPYNAIFTNCEFVIDSNYLASETFYKHVEMECVDGIRFLGCDFSVASNTNGVSSLCMGIGAYGAGFRVESYCESNLNPCPTNSLKRCTFTGFNNGILSVNEGNSAKTFTVRDAVFTNNHRGIFAQNTGYATIIKNEFYIGCNNNCGYGVYADGVTGFCIEENLFRPVSANNCTTYGVGIFNSGGVNDVYRNTFANLTCGNVSVGINYTSGNSGSVQGLTYSCNSNNSNDIDFCVLKDNGMGGINPSQGSTSSPTRNTFSGSQYYFYNDSNSNIYYYYASNMSHEIPITNKIHNVITYSTANTNSCASHYGNGGVIKSPTEKEALSEIYKTSEDAHERYMAAGDIIRSDINDTITNLTELRQWLRNMDNIASDRMIVASYIQEGDFTNAFAVANTLPFVYNLQGDSLSDHNDYMTLLNLYQTLYKSSRTVHELTENEKETVAYIAENGIGTSKLVAKGIMMETNDRYNEPYVCPDMPQNKGCRSDNTCYNNSYEEDDVLMVSLSPIPATTWVSVDYQLPEKASKAIMRVMSPLGNRVIDIELSGNKGSKAINLHDLSSGIYTYQVICGDHVKTGKLVVTK